jgi:2-methylcitrate dehydratase
MPDGAFSLSGRVAAAVGTTMTRKDLQPNQLSAVVEIVRAVVQQPIGDEERAAVLRCVIDSIGCGLAGIGDATAQRTAAAFGSAEGKQVTVLGSSRRLPVREALLVNAAAIRTLDFNDVYSARNNHHPSESVIPIALAFAELHGWSGRQLMDAVAVGYRISLTVGELWSGLLAKGWAPAASLGQLSSAGFIGTLLGFDDYTLSQAIAIAAVTAPTLAVVFRGELSDAKSLVSGLAVQAGWQAAELARAGVTGPRDVLEGPAGYDEMVGGPPELRSVGPESTTDARRVQQKAFPTVFTIHSAIEAALQVVNALGAGREATLADPGTRVEVMVAPKVAGMAASPARWNPTDRESAQFSLPYGVAVALLEGSCTVAGLRDAVNGSGAERTAELVSRMKVKSEERWDGYAGGRVVVSSPTGVLVEAEISDPPGSAANPLTTEEIETKFLALAATGRDRAFASRVLNVLSRLDEAARLDSIFAMFATDQDIQETVP